MHGYPRHTTYFPEGRERKRTNFNFIDNHSLSTSKQNLRYRRYATTIKFDLRHQLFLKKKNKTNFFYTSGKKNFHVAGKRGGGISLGIVVLSNDQHSYVINKFRNCFLKVKIWQNFYFFSEVLLQKNFGQEFI